MTLPDYRGVPLPLFLHLPIARARAYDLVGRPQPAPGNAQLEATLREVIDQLGTYQGLDIDVNPNTLTTTVDVAGLIPAYGRTFGFTGNFRPALGYRAIIVEVNA